MAIFLALWRLLFFCGILLVGSLRILAAGKKPDKDGVLPAAPIIVWMARSALRNVFGVDFAYEKPEIFRHHRGFIFPNHISFMDIVGLFAMMPLRFLSKAEIRRWVAIGWLTEQAGTVYVKRENKESRSEAREALAKAPTYPPLVLFPEGKINHEGKEILLPFRLGAFEIAVENQVPILPCVIIYDEPARVHWGDESIVQAGWRVLTHTYRTRARIVPLHVIHPTAQDDARQLALTTHAAMKQLLLPADADKQLLPDFFD